MTVAFWLALASGLAHALWNALAKSTRSERAATLGALAVAWALTAVARAFVSVEGVTSTAWPWLALAGGGEAAYVFSLGMAYRNGDLALTYALSRASALAFVWPLSWVAFGTVPPAAAVAATALVGTGIALVGPRAAGATSRWHPGWTLATGASVALYHTGYKGSLEAGTDALTAFVAALSFALPLLLVLVGREVRGALPPVLRQPRLVAAGALCAASFVLMLLALAESDSGRILGVRNASVGFAAVLAVLGGERLSPRQWAGLAVLTAGIGVFSAME